MSDSQSEVWVFDYVFEVLQSPTWEVPIQSFIDEHCLVFDAEEENKLIHTELHGEFKELVERLLNQHLAEVGVCEEDFYQACDRMYGGQGDGANECAMEVIEQIIACDDFMTFKTIMFRRNKELELEALSSLVDQQSGSSVDGEGKEACEDQSEAGDDVCYHDDEQDELELALEYSAALEQQRQIAELDHEQADVEAAIALSLAIEEERQIAECMAESKTADTSSSSGSKGVPSEGGRTQTIMAEGKVSEGIPSLGAKQGSLAPIPRNLGNHSVSQQRKLVEEYLLVDKSNGTSSRNVRNQSGSMITNSDSGIDEVELARRAKHLKKQRAKIIERKKQEREKKLREYEREKREQDKGKKSDGNKTKEIPTLQSAKLSEGQYLTYALARKMKNDLANDQKLFTKGKKSSGNVSSSLDEKLKAVEGIRKQKASIVRGR